MSRYTYLLDPGHGGMVDGEYVTSGKRSPEWDDKTFPDGTPYVLYEGVHNRTNLNNVLDALKALGIDAEDIVDSQNDVSLTTRINKVNADSAAKPCVLISIHSNAYGSGWTDPDGIRIYIYDGNVSDATRTMQDIFKTKINATMSGITTTVNKADNLAMVRDTSCPAILIEGGFHSNKAEAKLMISEEWTTPYAQGIVNAIQYIEENGLGQDAGDEPSSSTFTIPARGYFQIGDSGSEVMDIQKALDKSGFWTYDGYTEYYGDVTEAAVRNYQEAEGLGTDGKAGNETLTALNLI